MEVIRLEALSDNYIFLLVDRQQQIAAVVDRLEVSPRSVQVRDLGYRWGSCGHKGD